jgi:Tfp pilus assembly protein PilF
LSSKTASGALEEILANAERHLSRSFKLDPLNALACIDLAECYIRKGEWASADRCFRGLIIRSDVEKDIQIEAKRGLSVAVRNSVAGPSEFDAA